MKHLFIIIICISLLSSFAFAQSSVSGYEKLGGDATNTFQSGRGIFSELDADLVEAKVISISNGQKSPIIGDMDNDGINEIIVIDNNIVKVFQGEELTLVFAYNYGTTQKISNIIMFDIDGITDLELIFALEEDEEMHILKWNGTNLNLNNIIDLSVIPNHVGGNILYFYSEAKLA